MKLKQIAKHLLISSMLVSSQLGGLVTISAQESIEVNIDVFLQVQMNQPAEQTQISYDIIDADISQVVYSFRSNEAAQEPLELQPGRYILRIYDAQGFIRDGESVSAFQIEQSIPELSQEDIAAGRENKELGNVGSLNTLADGSVVYDIPFEIEAGPDLIDQTTQRMVTDLEILLADQTATAILEESENDESQTPQEQTGALEVRVLDQNETAVSNVGLTMGDHALQTDENGLAHINDLAAGDYQLTVSELPEGFTGQYQADLTIVPNEITQVTIQLESAPQTSSIQINIYDQNQEAVANAQIIVGEQVVTSNEEGVATVADLPVGDYYYAISSLPEGYTGWAEGTITVVADAITEVNIPVERQAQTNQAEITVVDQNDNPIAGVEIALGEQFVTTGENGVAVFNDMPIGDYYYYVNAIPEGFSGWFEGNLQVTADQVASTTVELESVAQTNSAEFTVVDQDGTAVPGVEITIADQVITTNENGMATVSDLPLSDYNYSITSLPEGYSGIVEGTLSITADASTRETLTVERQAQTGQAQITVVDQNSEGVQGVEIVLGDLVATTNENGMAAFSEVPVGDYYYYVNSLPEGYSGSAEGNLTVLANETATANITLERQAQTKPAEFSVSDQEGQPVANVEITVADQVITTNENGLALIENLAFGDYNYSITSLPEGYSGTAEGVLTVTADEEARVDLQVERSPQTTNVTFTVYDQNDNVIENVEITLNDQTVATNEAGVAVFDNIEAGTHEYTVSGLPANYEMETTTNTIFVPENEAASGTILVTYVEPAGDIQFNVHDQDGQAVTNAVIQIANQELTTNTEGLVTISELPLNTDYNYQLVSLPEGYTGQASDVVSANADETTVVDIQVNRVVEAGRFILIVNDQNADPVVGATVRLGEQTATTDDAGRAIFNEVVPGTYEYDVTELPQGYQGDLQTANIVIGEGVEESRTVAVTRDIQQRLIQFIIVDQNSEPVSGVEVTIAERTGESNSEGRVSFGDLNPGTYDYNLSNVPDNYSGQLTGSVELTEAEDATVTITLDREIELSTARIRVLDQNDQAVAQAVVKFGGLRGTTGEDGWVQFNSLEPGNYYYEVLEAPSNYVLSGEEVRAEIEEGTEFEASLIIERRLFGQVNIRILDNQNRPVQNALVRINNQEVRTNSDGVAAFEELEPGDYNFDIVEVPSQYDITQNSGTVTVQADQTVDQNVTVEVRPESSESEPVSESESEPASESESMSESESEETSEVSEESSDESSSISEESVDESEAEEATRRYVDDATGIEVWINPADAGNVVRLQTSRVTAPLDPLPSALNGKEYTVYDIQLLDRQNNPVELTRVAEIRIPIGQVRSQIQVLRINGANVSNLTNSVHNQTVTIRTQQLGRFAVVTGNAAVESSSESVSDESSDESMTSEEESESLSRQVSISRSIEESLPATGEIKSLRYITLAIVLIAFGFKFILNGLSSKNKKS